MTLRNAVMAAALAMGVTTQAMAQPAQQVTLAKDTRGPPAERAAAMLAQMTPGEKLDLVEGYFATDYPRTKFTAPQGARERALVG